MERDEGLGMPRHLPTVLAPQWGALEEGVSEALSGAPADLLCAEADPLLSRGLGFLICTVQSRTGS